MPESRSAECKCPQCAAVFFTYPSHVRKCKTPCCSRRCASLRRSAHLAITGKPGDQNPAWRGGETKSIRGYWYVRVDGAYVKRANIVAEREAGRRLLPNEVVHHKNRKRGDDSPDNLEIMDKDVHRALHNALRSRMQTTRKPESPSNRRYSWPSRDALIEMYAGQSIRQIAAVLGCNFKSVHRHMVKIGINLRQRGARSSSP